MSITERTRLLLFVRSGGRCAVCYEDVTRSGVTWRPLPLGEQAHVVGRSTGEKSPRGGDPLPQDERDDVNNLILLCGKCHSDVDRSGNLDIVTVERLQAIKHAHEARIEQILTIPPDNATAVVRLQGNIGDVAVHVDNTTAASTVLSANRFARFPLSADRAGLEIDLRSVPEPAAGNQQYYATCARQIDHFFQRQFLPAIDDGSVTHISLFALARWPLLVHLGTRLGDKVAADIYQRHRSTDSWRWPSDATNTEFEWTVETGDDERDAVLVLSMSASVKTSEVPHRLAASTVYRIVPANGLTPHYDIVATPESLKSAERAIRDVLAHIEQHRKHVTRLHVVGAAPLSVCVSLGRAITVGIHPQLVLYDRVEGTYQPALEVS